jgi:hypothetical protein
MTETTTNTETADAKAPKAKRQPVACSCGCGEPTMNAFRPGHDNRFYGQVVRGERSESDLRPFPGLARKWNNRNKAVARETKAAQVAESTGGYTLVKIGRWPCPIQAVKPTDDGRFEVDYTDRKGNTRTAIVDQSALS